MIVKVVCVTDKYGGLTYGKIYDGELEHILSGGHNHSIIK